MRVLIVEDEAKMAGLIRRGLEREGMTADVASKGEIALRDGIRDRVAGLESGADDYLVKPLSEESVEVVLACRAWLRLDPC